MSDNYMKKTKKGFHIAPNNLLFSVFTMDGTEK